MNPLIAQLIETRKRAGLSQKTVARRAGYDQCTISQWERGLWEPRLCNFVNLANTLGFEVALVKKESRAA